MRAQHIIAVLILASALVGCSDNGGDTAVEPTAATSHNGAPEERADADVTPDGVTQKSVAPDATPSDHATGAEELAAGEVSAESVAALIAAAIDVTTVTITENNDPNNLFGRPNGYLAATVIKDSRVPDCGDDLGVICGATVEEWPDAEAAMARADYIATLQKDSPILGSEYHYLTGPILLRVSGELKPSEAQEYEAAVAGD
jgi:hypothetical protein